MEMSWGDHMMGYNQLLLGGFTHFLCSIISWDNPIDSYFSRWLKHVKTTSQTKYDGWMLDVSE